MERLLAATGMRPKHAIVGAAASRDRYAAVPLLQVHDWRTSTCSQRRGNDRAMARPVLFLVAENGDVAVEFRRQFVEQRLLRSEMLVEVSEECDMIAIASKPMAQ